MRHISLAALYIGLNDLLTKRVAALESFPTGNAAKKLLTSKRYALSKLPSVAPGRPLVDELDATDSRHDALGMALWHFTEAYLTHPDAPENLVDAAKKIRAAFMPTLEDLGASYADEAKAAMDRKPLLQDLKSFLSQFPVAVGGANLYDWAEAFLASGTKIDSLLSARADLEKLTRKDAAKLRGEIVGLLNRMRKNLELELRDDPSLPADLDAQVFGYFDLLEKSAVEAQSKGKPEEIPPPPEAAPQGGTNSQ